MVMTMIDSLSMGLIMKRSVYVLISAVSFAFGLGQLPAVAADLAYKALPAAAEPIEYGNVYVGVDANTNHSLVGYTGVLYAPFGMDKSGLRLSAFGLYGGYQYNGDTDVFKGKFSSVDLLAGWSNVFQNGAATLSIGANFQDHNVKPFDAFNPVQGSEVGFKVQGDVWINPTERTLVFGLASYSTAFDTYYSILRGGYDFFGRGFFIGPEVGALGNSRTDQQRVGLHVTGLNVLKNAKLTLSGGWLHERDEKDAAYATAVLDFSF
jgi:hypothetical protein